MYFLHLALRLLIDPELDVIAGIAALMIWASKF